MKFPGGNDFFHTRCVFDWGNRPFACPGLNPKAEGGCMQVARAAPPQILVAQFQFLGDRLVTLFVLALQIIQKPPALADHHEQPAARAVVLLVHLQMLGQMINPLRQQRNLNIRRTCISGM
jgi:hypothetical protein